MEEKNTYQVGRKRYSSEELKEFEVIITKKLDQARDELDTILDSLGKKKENSTEEHIDMLEDSAEAAENERLSQLAARQRKFIAELEAALMRIKNGTYGVCLVTNELIDKQRLSLVPHTRYSLAAKVSGKAESQ